MVSDKVTTEEEAGLRDYELVVVFAPEVADEEFEAAVEGIARSITERGGVISDTDKWGKRKLAYPIKRFMEGNYVLFRFKMIPESGKVLEGNLRLSEQVIRHLLIKDEGKQLVTKRARRKAKEIRSDG
jgi:small subunit ribosomal protein S6